MATGQWFTRLFNKRILALADFKTGITDYLRSLTEKAVSLLVDLPTVMGTAVEVTATADIENCVTLGPSSGTRVMTDGQGKVIVLTAPDPVNLDVIIPPEIGNGEFVDIGIRACAIEDGVETNPRTGFLEYSTVKEAIGVVGNPDAVIDNLDGTISLVVNGFFAGGGLDFANSYSVSTTFRVWLTPRDEGGIGPKEALPANAFLTAEPTWDSVNSQYIVTLPSTLGQGSLPSTTPANYRMQLLGARVSCVSSGGVNLRTETGTVYIGSVAALDEGEFYSTHPSNEWLLTADQRVASFSLADMASVLARDQHGKTIISVRADASDNHEPKIQIIDKTGTRRFTVAEDGLLYLWGPDGSSIRIRLNSNGDINANAQAGTAGLFNGGTSGYGAQATGGPNMAGVRAVGGTGNAAGLRAEATGTGNAVEGVATSSSNPAFKAVTGYFDGVRMDTAAALNIGTSLQTNLTVGRSAAPTGINGSTVTGTAASGNFSIDSATANVQIGTGTANNVNIGRTTKTTNIIGPLNAQEDTAVTLIKASTNYKWNVARTQYRYLPGDQFMVVSGSASYVGGVGSAKWQPPSAGTNYIIAASCRLPVGAIVTGIQAMIQAFSGPAGTVTMDAAHFVKTSTGVSSSGVGVVINRSVSLATDAIMTWYSFTLDQNTLATPDDSYFRVALTANNSATSSNFQIGDVRIIYSLDTLGT